MERFSNFDVERFGYFDHPSGMKWSFDFLGKRWCMEFRMTLKEVNLLKLVLKRFLNLNWRNETHDRDCFIFDVTVTTIGPSRPSWVFAVVLYKQSCGNMFKAGSCLRVIQYKVLMLMEMKKRIASEKEKTRKKKYFTRRFKNIPVDLIDYIFKWV